MTLVFFVDAPSNLLLDSFRDRPGASLDVSFDPPEPWASAMIKVGAVDPRRKEPVPSITQLANRAGLAVETVRRLIRGDGVPDPDTISKVGRALRVGSLVVSGWANQGRTILGDYEPPDDANLLKADEREVLDRLIRLMVADRKSIRERMDELAGSIRDFPAPVLRAAFEDYDQEAAHTSPEPAGLPEPESP